MEMNGKNVVYVGGFGGIGFAACKILVQRHVASLFILDIAENKKLFEELRCLSSRTTVYFEKLDICQKDQVIEVIKNVISTINYIDILVNGCGTVDDQQPEQTMAVNLMGVIYTTMTVLPYMDKTKGGRGGMIVNIASVLGLEPGSCLAIYTASKHGVMGFTRSISDEFYYKRTDVAVMAICPGITVAGLFYKFKDSGTFPCSAELTNNLLKANNQSADACADNLVKAMETGKNASIWILDLGKLREVNPTTYWIPTFN